MAVGKRAEDLFGPVSVELEQRHDGAQVLRSTAPLQSYPATICHHLESWAQSTPTRAFLAARDGDGSWREASYADFRAQARAVASALLAQGLTAQTPIIILSDNSIENALVQFGAMYAGVPVVPVSPAYSLLSKDLGKLHFIADLVRPALVFADDGAVFDHALAAVDWKGATVVCARNGPDSAVELSLLLQATDELAVNAAFASTGPDTIAKILFTSGSTGQPKGVVNTHRMMCSNQQAIAQMWPFIERRPPVLLDWLPWHHTFGGNHNINMTLRNGGTLYIDAGKPVPGLVEQTIANLRDVSPTLYFNVPRGYDMIVQALESDETLRRKFFDDLDLLFYSGAALPQSLWSRLEGVARKAGLDQVVLTTALGSTETSPLAVSAHFALERAGVVGVPAPGTEVKLVQSGDKQEMRIRGPNVTPGYFRRDDLTEQAFDEEGFYQIGDALRLADPADPNKGFVFDGRVSEDFKLLTGTWVSAGVVRVAAIAACSPLIQDCVVSGRDRDEIGLLIFPNVAACVAFTEEAGETGEVQTSQAVCKALRLGLERYNLDNPASSTRIARALIMSESPSIDANEITDKGYINQRAVLERRQVLVDKLHAGNADDDILIVG